MQRVKCKSGLKGWQCKLQDVYMDFAHFQTYDEIYGLAKRLGYRSAAAAWKANPTIQGSTNPSDYCRVA